jgi:hypothetical protein
MTDFIEQDALSSTPDAPLETHEHTHEEVKSFLATPRFDPTLKERVVGLFKARDKPGVHVVQKAADGLRTMFVVTSNSYEDREFETITSQALKDYEASCYPGDDLFHCDNPYVLWHDDDAPIGEIIAVNYSEPFLVEIVKELPTPFARLIWDFAEENGDNAGASHRFGYMERDREPDGTFHRIFKQETSYLPDRSLAANIGTYSGVMSDMATAQSDAWLDKIILERTGGAIKDGAKKLHARTGILDKELEALGITHKAAKPPFPPKTDEATKPVMEGEIAADDAVIEEDAEVMDEKEEMPPPAEAGAADMARMLVVMDSFYNMLSTMMDQSAASELDRVGMLKTIDELKEARVSEKAAEKVTLDGLMDKLKSLEARFVPIEKQLSLAPRSASQTQASSDPEIAKRIVNEAIDGAEKAKKEGDLIESSMFGKVLPPIKYD